MWLLLFDLFSFFFFFFDLELESCVLELSLPLELDDSSDESEDELLVSVLSSLLTLDFSLDFLESVRSFLCTFSDIPPSLEGSLVLTSSLTSTSSSLPSPFTASIPGKESSPLPTDNKLCDSDIGFFTYSGTSGSSSGL